MNTLILHPSQTMTGLAEALDGDVVTIDLNDTPQPSYCALEREHDGFSAVVGAPDIWIDDEDRSMDEEFVMAVEILQPDVFVLETVRGLASPRNEAFLHDLVDDLAALGYRVGYEVVKLDGRKRLLIIGHNGPRHTSPVFRGRQSTIASIITKNLEVAA